MSDDFITDEKGTVWGADPTGRHPYRSMRPSGWTDRVTTDPHDSSRESLDSLGGKLAREGVRSEVDDAADADLQPNPLGRFGEWAEGGSETRKGCAGFIMLLGLATVVVLSISLLSWGCEAISSDPAPERPTGPTTPPVGSRDGAVDVCHQFVTDRLKAPATAGFENSSERTAVLKANDTWVVDGHVDSQNSFGAEIRTFYECTVRYTRAGSYSLVSLDMT